MGSARLTYGQPPAQTPYAQLRAKREDLTRFMQVEGLQASRVKGPPARPRRPHAHRTHNQAWHGTSRRSRHAEPDTGGPGITALARYDPDGQTVTLVLDAATANTAIYAITAHAQEREAHLREIQLHAQDLPEGSYGRRNRQAITDRESRITTRLRAIEHAYQTAIERDTTAEPARPLHSPDRAADREIDLG